MKERIIVDFDRNEFDFIKGAIEYKSRVMLNYFDECKAEADKEDGGAFSAFYKTTGFQKILDELIDQTHEIKPVLKKRGRPSKLSQAKGKK